LKQGANKTSLSKLLRETWFTSPSPWRRKKGASFEVTPPIAGGGAACNCFSSNQTGLCSASDPDQTIGDDCECFNKGQAEAERCQPNKRHKILLNDKDSSHQCSLFIKSATKADTGQIKIYSNFGGLISECRLVVKEPPQADDKLAFFSLVVVVVVITVTAVIAAIVKLVYTVKARRPADQNLDPASAPPIEHIPLVNQNHNASQVTNTGTDNDDDPVRSTPSTCQAV